MATAPRLGFPAINDPRGAGLRDLQQVVANIRERFKGVDGSIAGLQTNSATAFTVSGDVAAIKKQLVNLQAELDALEAVVAALELGGFETDPRTEQLAGELLEIREALSDEGGAERVPAIEAAVATLQRQVDDLDTVGQTPAHSAMLHDLQDQIRSINLGVLV